MIKRCEAITTRTLVGESIQCEKEAHHDGLHGAYRGALDVQWAHDDGAEPCQP